MWGGSRVVVTSVSSLDIHMTGPTQCVQWGVSGVSECRKSGSTQSVSRLGTITIHHTPAQARGQGCSISIGGAFGVFCLRLKTKSKCPAPRVRSSKLKKKKIWNWPCPELVRSKACFKHLLSLQSWRWYVKIVTAPLSARHRAVIQCSDCQGLRGIELETKVHGVFLYVVLEERPYYGILFVLPTSSFTHKNLLRHYAKRALNKPWWLKIGTLTQIS